MSGWGPTPKSGGFGNGVNPSPLSPVNASGATALNPSVPVLASSVECDARQIVDTKGCDSTTGVKDVVAGLSDDIKAFCKRQASMEVGVQELSQRFEDLGSSGRSTEELSVAVESVVSILKSQGVVLERLEGLVNALVGRENGCCTGGEDLDTEEFWRRGQLMVKAEVGNVENVFVERMREMLVPVFEYVCRRSKSLVSKELPDIESNRGKHLKRGAHGSRVTDRVGHVSSGSFWSLGKGSMNGDSRIKQRKVDRHN